MKIIKCIATAAILSTGLIVLASCCGNPKRASKGAKSETTAAAKADAKTEARGLQMSVSPAVSAGVPEKVEVKLTNGTESLAQFGAEFTVEHWDGNKWVQVAGTENFPVIMILYSLPAGASETYEFYLRPEVVKYEKGRYRLSKTVSLDNERSETVAAEFEIE